MDIANCTALQADFDSLGMVAGVGGNILKHFSGGDEAIYLDANATTALSTTALEAMLEVLTAGAHNPSSAHAAGDDARWHLERSRDAIALALGNVDPSNVFFTSGGTEGNNLVIRGFSRIEGAICGNSTVEHASVTGPVSDTDEAFSLEVGRNGYLNLDLAQQKVVAARSRARPVLVCIQAANSETGIAQPLPEIISGLKGADENVYFHVDAAQAFGRMTLDLDGIDAMTFSGHKLHGPAGTGFLYLSDQMLSILPRLIKGGGQEAGVRPGTQNVAGIVGFAAAVTERMESFQKHLGKLALLRDRLERAVLETVSGTVVIGRNSARVPNTSNIQFSGRDAQQLLAALDAGGVMCSVGSACSSAKPDASPVLKAMGLSEDEASSCLRFSVSVLNTEAEIDAAVRKIAAIAAQGRA